MSSMKKLIIAVAASSVITSAFAWGDREQGALLGLVIGAVAGSQAEQNNQRIQQQSQQAGRRYDQPPSTVYIQTQPIYQQTQPVIVPIQRYCFQQHVIDQYGRIIGVQTVCN